MKETAEAVWLGLAAWIGGHVLKQHCDVVSPTPQSPIKPSTRGDVLMACAVNTSFLV